MRPKEDCGKSMQNFHQIGRFDITLRMTQYIAYTYNIVMMDTEEGNILHHHHH